MTNTTRELKLLTNTFDRDNTFSVDLPRLAGFRCSLHRDYKVRGDGILWVMQHASMICSSYSEEQVAEIDRLKTEPKLRNGEVVTVEGKLYRVRVLGDYSTAALLDPIDTTAA